MSKLFILSSIAVMFLATAFTPGTRVQETLKPVKGIEEVISALGSGNAQELAKYIDDNVEIALPDKSDSYSKAQSIMVLKDFFANNPVLGFDKKFSGENGGSQFCVGTLRTKSGNYRTTVFMKTKDGKEVVKEIRFQSK
jgi:Domain of unknown function (DUF4783)